MGSRVTEHRHWRQGDIVAMRERSGRYVIKFFHEEIEVYLNLLSRLDEVYQDSIDDPLVRTPLTGGYASIHELETIPEHELRVCAEMRARGHRLVNGWDNKPEFTPEPGGDHGQR